MDVIQAVLSTPWSPGAEGMLCDMPCLPRKTSKLCLFVSLAIADVVAGFLTPVCGNCRVLA